VVEAGQAAVAQVCSKSPVQQNPRWAFLLITSYILVVFVLYRKSAA
jgi:hypothetical protein